MKGKILITVGLLLLTFFVNADNSLNIEKTNLFIKNEIKEIIFLINEKEEEKLSNKVDVLLKNNYDSESFVKSVLGRNYWLKASGEERISFSNVISKKLKRTYLNIFKSYSNEKIITHETTVNKIGTIYKTKVIVNQSGKKISVLFFTSIKKDKILIKDLVVEGISLRRSFKSGYSKYLKEKGINGTIEKIKEELKSNV